MIIFQCEKEIINFANESKHGIVLIYPLPVSV